MDEAALFWDKWSAIGQLLGAAATFLAVLVSLFIAFQGRRPRLKLRAGIYQFVTNGEFSDPILLFEVANAGDRPVHIRGVGWHTGWLRWGPKFLRLRHAVQVTGSIVGSIDPPYELQPGGYAASYAKMSDVLEHARERKDSPFFTRDWPVLGRRLTRVRAYAYTADGFEKAARPAKDFLQEIAVAEREVR